MRGSKVSVIMASYNHEKYVTRAIESVLAQTYHDWELIIIDDCSSDHSAEAIRQYQDDKVKFIQAKDNKGPIRTFNQLLEEAQGEYVAILGSDDEWYPDKLKKQVECMESIPEAGACFTHAVFVDENGKIYSDSEDVDFNINIFNHCNRTQSGCMRYFYEYGNYFCHPSSMVRKRVLDEIGGFDLRFRQLHDYHYWVRLLQHYPVHIIQEPLVYYRRVRDNNTSVSAGNEKNTVRLYNESQIIIYEMLKEMKMDIFCEAFADMLKKKVENEIQLICEKYFVLLRWELVGNNNRLMAVRFLNAYLDDPDVTRCLREEYGYTLSDYYEETGCKMQLYPLHFYQEYREIVDRYQEQKRISEELQDRAQKAEDRAKEYSNELQAMRQTTSWKITRPLREAKGSLKKFKKKPKRKGTTKK